MLGSLQIYFSAAEMKSLIPVILEQLSSQVFFAQFLTHECLLKKLLLLTAVWAGKKLFRLLDENMLHRDSASAQFTF